MRTSIRLLCLALACALPMSALQAAESFMLPAPDLAKLQMEDGKAGGAYRYGIQIPVQGFSFDGHSLAKAQWQQGADGIDSFSWALTAPGARTLDFHFSTLVLPEGATLTLRGSGKDNVRKLTAADIGASEGFWAPYIAGENVRIELRVPAKLRSQARVELASVTHGYRGLFESTDPLQKSGSCNVDVACSAGSTWTDQIDAVGHYTFSQGGGSFVCTGTLMGNAAGTAVPYFLTANHCLSTQAVASTVVVYWNYQSATCRTPGSTSSGTPLSKTLATHTQSGTTLVSTNAASDFALLRLNADVPAASNPYWSGWDATTATPSSAAGIHHPAGHEKRIAIEDQALTISGYGGGGGSTHWRVNDWDQGTTEGGSSGSGLWNPSKRLVGQLHGGSAACGNNLSDYYGRLSVSWTGGGSASTRLRDWLDPNSSGLTSVAGYRGGSAPPPPPPPPPSNTLSSGVPITGLSAATGGELRYILVVPAGASNLSFVTSGGSGDADLYVRFGSAPTTATYDCRPYQGGNSETCSFAAPQAGTYHVMLRAYSAFSGVSLVGSFSSAGGSQPSLFQNTADYAITDNATVESPIAVSGRGGSASSALKVDVRILHTYKGDLRVDVVAPNGAVFNLHNRTGGSADNVIGVFTINASAAPANGTWKLRVNDNASGDTGTVDRWSLQF